MKFPKFRRKNDNYEDDYNDYYGEDSYYDDDSANDDMDVNNSVVDDVYSEPEKINDSHAFEMKLITPKSYDDREDIARCLINGSAVFLNIEALSRDNIIRLMDYLGGVIYVIEGKVKWSNSSSVIFAPRNVNISGLDEEEEEVGEAEEIEENDAE